MFCFIDQMPKGMRETLYFKDDDSRLSFLQGNYITLTNMSDHDIDRIIKYHLEPINISFHTTNPELRCKMLSNRFAGEALKKAWEEQMQTARFEIFVLGDCDANLVGDAFTSRFSSSRRPVELQNTVLPARGEVQHLEETFPVEQAKVVMGFRFKGAAGQQDAARVMTSLFGGSPSSKLFANVREKQSLCYYCGARTDLLKDAMFVESGVDMGNIQAVQAAVLEQLRAVQNGDFTDDEAQKARLALANGCRTVKDYLGSTENWYLSQLFSSCVRSPEEDARRLLQVGREGIIRAAQDVTLDTVYVLKGKGKA